MYGGSIGPNAPVSRNIPRMPKIHMAPVARRAASTRIFCKSFFCMAFIKIPGIRLANGNVGFGKDAMKVDVFIVSFTTLRLAFTIDRSRYLIATCDVFQTLWSRLSKNFSRQIHIS